MNDSERAIAALDGHTIALVKGERILTSDSRGISPMLEFIECGEQLDGFSVADLIVGKAAALLFAYAGIAAVHARVMSRSAVAVLERFGIRYTCDALVAAIINRKGDGVCPMEQATAGVDDPKAAVVAIKNKISELNGK